MLTSPEIMRQECSVSARVVKAQKNGCRAVSKDSHRKYTIETHNCLYSPAILGSLPSQICPAFPLLRDQCGSMRLKLVHLGLFEEDKPGQ